MRSALTLVFRRLLVSIMLGAAIGYLYGASTPLIAHVGAIIVSLYEYPRVYSGGGADPTTMNIALNWLENSSPFAPSYHLINLGFGYGLQAGAIVGIVNLWVEGVFLRFIHKRQPGKLYGYLLGALGGYLIAAKVFLDTIEIVNATSLEHYLYSTLFVLPVFFCMCHCCPDAKGHFASAFAGL